MHLLLCVLLLKAVWAEETSVSHTRSVTAYEGQSITLHSGAAADWKLTSITWSILPNTTWIATYSEDTTNVDHFYKYKGRLELDKKTGDLILNNVGRGDAMEYTVDFYNDRQQNKVNKIKLNIKQPLQPPTIQTIQDSANDTCLLVLQCSSQDSGVSLSWETSPSVQYYNDTDNKIVVLLKRTETSVNFTCVSTKDTDKVSHTIPVKCKDPSPSVTTSIPTPTSFHHKDLKNISRDPIFLVPGFLFGVLTSAFIVCMSRRREKAVFPWNNSGLNI